eukprot:PhM_4_TR1347/c0_g1_i2/m.52696
MLSLRAEVRGLREKLDVEGAKVTPAKVFSGAELAKIHVDEVEIRLVRLGYSTFGDVVAFTRFALLKVLDLTSNRFSSLPLSVLKTLKGLQELHLDDNEFSEIPSGFGELSALSTLSMSSNRLTSFPAKLRLPKLSTLNVSDNQIHTLAGVEQFSQLTCLDVSGNQLTSLKGLEKLSRLQELIADGNAICCLDGIERLTEIRHFSAPHNKIRQAASIVTSMKSIPSPFRELKKLCSLDLSWNEISSLTIFPQLPAVTELSLAHNAFCAAPSPQKTKANQLSKAKKSLSKAASSKKEPSNLCTVVEDATYVTDDDDTLVKEIRSERRQSTSQSSKLVDNFNEPTQLNGENDSTFTLRLATLFPSLTSLDISDNDPSLIPSYASLAALAKCKNLTEISISGTVSMTTREAHVRAVHAYLPEVDVLDGLTDIAALVQTAPPLKITEVSGESTDSRPTTSAGSSRPGTASARPTSASVAKSLSMRQEQVKLSRMEEDYEAFLHQFEDLKVGVADSLERIQKTIQETRELANGKKQQEAPFESEKTVRHEPQPKESRCTHIPTPPRHTPPSTASKSKSPPKAVPKQRVSTSKTSSTVAVCVAPTRGPVHVTHPPTNALARPIFQVEAARHREQQEQLQRQETEELLSSVSNQPPKQLLNESGTQGGCGVLFSQEERKPPRGVSTETTMISPREGINLHSVGTGPDETNDDVEGETKTTLDGITFTDNGVEPVPLKRSVSDSYRKPGDHAYDTRRTKTITSTTTNKKSSVLGDSINSNVSSSTRSSSNKQAVSRKPSSGSLNARIRKV